MTCQNNCSTSMSTSTSTRRNNNNVMSIVIMGKLLLFSLVLITTTTRTTTVCGEQTVVSSSTTTNESSKTAATGSSNNSSSSSSSSSSTGTIDPTSLYSSTVSSFHSLLKSNIVSNSLLVSSLSDPKNNEEWWYDLMNLPYDVPYPGTKWLERIKKNDDNKSKNVYESIVYNFQPKNVVLQIQSKNNVSSTSTSTTESIIQLQSNITINACRNINAYINSIFVSTSMAETIYNYTNNNYELTHYIICYIRNFICAMILYYTIGGLFHYGCYIYNYNNSVFGSTSNSNTANKRQLPTTSIIINQILLSQCSMFIYVLLPVFDEYIIENNYTVVYYTISDIGNYKNYLLYLFVYFIIVEIGIYWMHRTLHTNKILYKYIHMKHHQYNKIYTLTPWASIAFHPLDGILQASPYVVCILFIPCHYITHLLLLFFTAIWATYIHDAMDYNFGIFGSFIMGSKYHTIHHTHYIYNYGQVFIFCDYIFGTLYTPIYPTGSSKTTTKTTKTLY